jgi:integrase/recombinase XerD
MDDLTKEENLPAVIDSAGGVDQLPELVVMGGGAARFVWDEFFSGEIRNPHTRRAYGHAVRQFLAWCRGERLNLQQIAPGHVGRYLDQLSIDGPAEERLPASVPTKKQHLAALRRFFDKLVLRHVVVLNPAASVRAERYQVIEGKTPEISVEQAKKLLKSFDTSRVIGLRDRAIIATLIYTAVRIGSVAVLRFKNFNHDGSQWTLRFAEKGGKSREIPVRHALERYMLAYLDAAGLRDASKDSRLFRSAVGKTKHLTGNGMSAGDMGRMVKRRLKDAGLPEQLSPHSFRVATITDLLEQGTPLEDVQQLAGHADPRTTRLYDRRPKRISRNIVDRISIYVDDEVYAKS